MKIPLFKNYWDSTDTDFVDKVIKRGMDWANGPEIKEFEKQIAKLAKRKYALTFNSGTSALHAVLMSIGVAGKEVIVPSFTFIATANAVLMAGGKVVFADIEKERFGLDPEDVAKKITKNTVAIVPVHYGGLSCRIKELTRLAKTSGVALVEDAAESLGAVEQGRMVGSFGEAAMFSFTPAKVISCGEGGALVTNSLKMYNRLIQIRSHGRLDYNGRMEYVSLGYNFRMPTVCAAWGLAQIQKLDKLVEKRREIADFYSRELGDIDALILPRVPEDSQSVFQVYSVLIKKGQKAREQLIKFLAAKGIDSKINFPAVHKFAFYKKQQPDVRLPITEEISSQVLSLPMYPQLTIQQQRFIVRAIKKHFQND